MMFPNLFSPLKIGTVEVKNRISFQPHLTNFAVDCLPSERHMYYWGERAKGGRAKSRCPARGRMRENWCRRWCPR